MLMSHSYIFYSEEFLHTLVPFFSRVLSFFFFSLSVLQIFRKRTLSQTGILQLFSPTLWLAYQGSAFPTVQNNYQLIFPQHQISAELPGLLRWMGQSGSAAFLSLHLDIFNIAVLQRILLQQDIGNTTAQKVVVTAYQVDYNLIFQTFIKALM